MTIQSELYSDLPAAPPLLEDYFKTKLWNGILCACYVYAFIYMYMNTYQNINQSIVAAAADNNHQHQ